MLQLGEYVSELLEENYTVLPSKQVLAVDFDKNIFILSSTLAYDKTKKPLTIKEAKQLIFEEVLALQQKHDIEQKKELDFSQSFNKTKIDYYKIKEN